MHIAAMILNAAGLVPLTLALRANRGASLMHALVWSIIAWLSWGVAFLAGHVERDSIDPARYCALCLTGCAGVAVLGARRPHVFAWNFVVLGLFSVMVLPLVQTLLLGTHPVEGLRIFFLAATLAVGILNYLPTRLAPAAFLMLLSCTAEIVGLYVPQALPVPGALGVADLLLMSAPWLAWICVAQKRLPRTEFDELWLTFRDRWGLVWGQRVREQFNHAAKHAGWPVRLYWQGLVLTEHDVVVTQAERAKMVGTLRAALQRFADSADSR